MPSLLAVTLRPGRTMSWAAGVALFIGSSSYGGVPSALNSTVPCQINLVGSTGGVADARGQFTIIVRDVSSPTPQVCPFTPVIIDFNECTPDIRVCSAQPYAGVTADCVAPVGKITATTDVNGMVVMRIVGGGLNGGPAAGFKCASIYAGSPAVFLGRANVGIFDENGAGGVNPTDISIWFGDWASPGFEGRSDYNCSHSINAADLSIFLDASLAGGSFNSCSVYCH